MLQSIVSIVVLLLLLSSFFIGSFNALVSIHKRLSVTYLYEAKAPQSRA